MNSQQNTYDAINLERDISLEDIHESQQSQVNQRHKRKKKNLDFSFFKPEETDEDVDRGWDLFLQVASKMPGLEERIKATGEKSCDAVVNNLNELLCQLRIWIKRECPTGLSLRLFAECVERLSSSPVFSDYRIELIRRYKSNNWKNSEVSTELNPSAPGASEESHPIALYSFPSPKSYSESSQELFTKHSLSYVNLPRDIKQRQEKIREKRLQLLKKKTNETDLSSCKTDF